ncbi:MAG: ATP-binding cassette domain-containing protein [Deltaproteobacteria bacterium]|nr:ATP-binding cassette domain-containing protein [Deltaproteobacteria bacterium]
MQLRIKKYFPVRRGFFQNVIGWIKAVDGVDLYIDKQKTLGLVGESGCGKSTIGRLILKLLEPDEGKIIYQDKDISSLSPDEMKPLRKEMQIIFQDPFGSLNPRMTAGQSIEEGLRTLPIKGHHERKRRIIELLNMVGIASSGADRYPHEFSGGQRQRIGIARALSVNPSLIICDEPVSALDVSIQSQIINLLKEPIEEIYNNPLHPYTLALLSAIPEPDPDDRGERKTLTGDVPSPFNPPPGCKFQGRCPLVEDRCKKEEIAFYTVNENHTVRCWKVVGG